MWKYGLTFPVAVYDLFFDILENVLIPYSDEFLPVVWVHQRDNYPKYTAKAVKKCLSDYVVVFFYLLFWQKYYVTFYKKTEY